MDQTAAATFEAGNLRIQPLGPHLVRIEVRGPKGFEDRETFTIQDRRGAPVAARREAAEGATRVATATYRVVVPAGAAGLEGVRIETAAGAPLCVLSNALLARKFLPAPSALPAVWVLGDAPRVAPPAWGARPPPPGVEDPHSGWDLANDAPDAYVFFPAAAGYAGFREDFLRLTGAVPLVPLFALGLWYSRYHPYSEAEALAVIDRFRQAGMPLDLFTLDTDWRVGASCGYEINADLFPDMGRFIREAHARGARVMLNDHPEPRGRSALDPEELRFRQRGLASLLERGADVWWFDRNWHTHLQAPAPGLEKEVWGMRLYHDLTRDFRPERRPLILANADGIDNGRLDAPAHPAAHRYPAWWTGDTVAEWRYLRMGVANAVESGLHALTPYVHEDLGGHHGQPGAELFVRFMQFGAFSPVARIHCTTKVHRHPWEYGAEVERIVGDHFRLRRRLLPTLYAAAHEAHRTGTPLLRRCDLEWPEHPEAADSTQYLLGDDLLVAPILAPARDGRTATRGVWLPPGEWEDLWTGTRHRGPATIGVACDLRETPLFVRAGGMVLSAPPAPPAGPAEWPELVVDAYAPTADGEARRFLCEDDGLTTAHERGASVRTEFRLAQAGRTTTVRVAPGPADRRLTVRIHLPRGAVLLADGGDVLAPTDAREAMPFAGAGARPPRDAGPVREWRGTLAAGEGAEVRVETR